MKKNELNYQYFGEWVNFYLYDFYFWYNKKVNEYLYHYFDVKRNVAVFSLESQQYLFVDSDFFRQIERQVEELSQEKLLLNLEKFYPIFDNVKKELLKFIDVDFSLMTKVELSKFFLNIRDLVNKITPFDQYAMISERVYLNKFEDYLRIELAKLGKDSDFVKYRTILSTPEHLSSTQAEEKSLVQMAIKYRDNVPILDSEIEKHVRDFGWLPVFNFGPHWDFLYIESQIKKLSCQSGLEVRLEELNNYKLFQINKIKELESNFGSSELWSKLFRELAFIRNEAETLVSLTSYILKPFYKLFCDNYCLNQREMRQLTPPEISEIILENLEINKDEIVRRMSASVLISSTEDEEILESESALDFFDQLFTPQNKSSDIGLKGMSASLGNAVGVVKIISSIKDIEKFNKGDILVSQSTCIDYVPIMRIAGAVVTELGGITSHASLVSRELNIPCVVGVPNVHVVLKDGDRILVDATEGVIKKIS